MKIKPSTYIRNEYSELSSYCREAAVAYTIEEREKALTPVVSIRNKNLTARQKQEEGTSWYKRFTTQIEAMEVAEALIEE